MSPAIAHWSDHVVMLNLNDKAGRIVDEIVVGSSGCPPDIVLLVQDPTLWQEHPEWHPRSTGRSHWHVIEGCPAEPSDLGAVGIDRARAAIILADPRQGALADAHSTLIAVAVERRNPEIHTVMELIESVNRVHLRSTEVNEVVCLGELTEQLIAQSCVTPGIIHVYAHLLCARPDTAQFFVCELPPEAAGLTYRQLVRRVINSESEVVVCGFLQHTQGGSALPPKLVLNPRPGRTPGKDTPLSAEDRLVVVAYQRPDLRAAPDA